MKQKIFFPKKIFCIQRIKVIVVGKDHYFVIGFFNDLNFTDIKNCKVP